MFNITVAFYKECYAAQFREHFKTQEQTNFFIIPIDENVEISDDFSQYIKHYEDFLSEDELLSMDGDAARYACNWYKKLPQNLFEAVPWGVFIEYQMQAKFSVIFKQIALLSKIKPTRIIICNENDVAVETIIEYAKQSSIPTSLLTINQESTSVNQLEKLSIRKNSKSFNNFIKPNLRILLQCFSNVIFKIFFNNKNKKRAIIIPYLHVNHFVKTLLNDNEWEVFLFKDRAGCTRNYFGKFFTISTPKKDNTSDKSSKREVYELIDQNLNNSLVFKDINVWPILRKYFISIYEEKIAHLTIMFNFYTKLFDRYTFQFVMVNQDFTEDEKILVYSANQKKINTIVVAHGAFIPPIPMVSPIAKQFYFWDYFSNKFYQDVLEISNQCISLVNNEYLHTLQVESPQQIKKDRKFLKIEENEKVFLFFCPVWVSCFAYSSPQESSMILKDICEVFSKKTDMKCIIRFHPSVRYYENVDYKINTIKKHGGTQCIIDPGLPLKRAISVSDAIIALDTTAIFEGIFLKKPVLLYNPTTKTTGDFFFKNDAVLSAKNKDELILSITSLLGEKNDLVIKAGNNFVQRYCSKYPSIIDTVTKNIQTEVRNG